MKPHERRVEAAYLAHCSPDEAYRWLERHAPRSDEDLMRGWYDDKLLEYILCSRRDPLIDLALARYGRTPLVIRKVFRRGGSGIRCAAWINPANGRIFSPAGIWCDRGDLKTLAKTGHIWELEAFVSNIGLNEDGIISFIRRENEFSEITERRYIRALRALADNPRLGTAYSDTRPMDGWAEHTYNKVFDEVWGLTLTQPVDQKWAEILAPLIRNCSPPVGFDVNAAITRWRIDLPKMDTKMFYWPGSSFHLRTHIADALPPDDVLKDADDFALRLSFYRRLDPARYPTWPDLVARDFNSWDPEQAAYDVLLNKHLWRKAEQRNRLGELCWAVPDPNAVMQLPNAYRETMRRMESEFPLWFTDEDRIEPEVSPLEAEIRGGLSDLSSKVDQLIDLATAQPKSRRFWFADEDRTEPEASPLEAVIREGLSDLSSKMDRLMDLATAQPKSRRFPFG